MSRRFCLLVMLSVLTLTISLNLGCNRSKEKMKVPDIKMITKEDIHGVMAPDKDNIWICGAYGTIYHSADGGETWVQQESGIKETTLIDGTFLNNKTGWIVGHYGVILHTADGGTTWTRQDSGLDKHLFSICFVNEKIGWAAGEWSTILHTTDSGTTWSRQTEEVDKIFSNILFTDPLNGWIVGEAGIIQHSSDGGKTWQEQMPKSFERASIEELFENQRPALFNIFARDKQTVLLCGMDGHILRTADAGKTWDVMPTGTKLSLYSLFLIGNRGWAVGDKGAYLTSSDSGKTWQVQDDVIKSKFWFRDIYFSNADTGWVVGQSGTAVRTSDGGKTWHYRSGLSYAMDFFRMPKALEFKGMVTE